MYLTIHLTLFAKLVITDTKNRCKAKCCKGKPRKPVIPTTSENKIDPDEEQAPAEGVLNNKLSRRQKRQKKIEEYLRK